MEALGRPLWAYDSWVRSLSECGQVVADFLAYCGLRGSRFKCQ